MAEKEGFEPPRRFRPPGFQDRSLQPDLGISPLPFYKSLFLLQAIYELYHNIFNNVNIFSFIYKQKNKNLKTITNLSVTVC